MKKFIFNILLAAVALLGVTSCGTDNFDEPESTLEGNITYQGKPLQLPGTGGVIRLNAYQDGYALHSPFSIYVDQNGHFSAKVFNGTYKLIPADNVGPWVNDTRDTITVNVNGNVSKDIEVTPYFLVNDFQCSINGNTVSLSFNIQQIVNSANIDHATFCVSSTAIVDDHNNAFAQDIPGSDLKVGANTINLTLNDDQAASINSLRNINVRLGLRTAGASQSIFSEIVKLK